MKRLLKGPVGTVLLVSAAAAIGYFGNYAIQSYLGKRAFANTGLESLSLAEAKEAARATNRKVLVDVSAVWCGNCRKLDNEVLANEKVREFIERHYVFSRLEYGTPEADRFLKQRNTDGVPNLWVIDPNGTNPKRVRLTYEPSHFREQLRLLRNR